MTEEYAKKMTKNVVKFSNNIPYANGHMGKFIGIPIFIDENLTNDNLDFAVDFIYREDELSGDEYNG